MDSAAAGRIPTGRGCQGVRGTARVRSYRGAPGRVRKRAALLAEDRQGEFLSASESIISTYAPYCDAIVVDNLMFQWATDPLIDLPKRFGVRLFSRLNWDEFLTYLADLAASQRPEVDEALKMIHPAGARTPEWIRRGSALVSNTDGV